MIEEITDRSFSESLSVGVRSTGATFAVARTGKPNLVATPLRYAPALSQSMGGKLEISKRTVTIPGVVDGTAACFGGSRLWCFHSVPSAPSKLIGIDLVSLDIKEVAYSGFVGNVLKNGMTFDGNNIWLSTTAGRIYRYDINADKVDQFIIGSRCESITFDGQYIWAASSYDNIAKVDPVTGSVVGGLYVGFTNKSLSFDGTFLWACNYDTVAKVDVDTNSVVASYSSGTYSDNLVLDGERAWVYSQTPNQITAYRMWDFMTAFTVPMTGMVMGMHFDGYNLWALERITTPSSLWNIHKINVIDGSSSIFYSKSGYNDYPVSFDGANIWVCEYNSWTRIPAKRYQCL